MSQYKENPKMKGSGLLGAIPQTGVCPVACHDCFFQSGRSFLEPLDENLPNMPLEEDAAFRVVRVNDGNDSNNRREFVEEQTAKYPMRFYNTSMYTALEKFSGPVVVTINPGRLTDTGFHRIDPVPPNLMFVRYRANTWNQVLMNSAIQFYAEREIPVVLTFMAYFDEGDIPDGYMHDYVQRKRTLNTYWAITTSAWERVMYPYRHNKWVYSCGKIEGEKGTSACHRCGNCLREYFYTREKMLASDERTNDA